MGKVLEHQKKTLWLKREGQLEQMELNYNTRRSLHSPDYQKLEHSFEEIMAVNGQSPRVRPKGRPFTAIISKAMVLATVSYIP